MGSLDAGSSVGRVERVERFTISYNRFNRIVFTVLGLAPRWCRVEVSADELAVRFSWGFQARLPRAAVRSAEPYVGRVFGWGVHGWRGSWLVNGSSQGIVQIIVDPPARGRVIGWPVRLRTLWVGVDRPDDLIAALVGATTADSSELPS